MGINILNQKKGIRNVKNELRDPVEDLRRLGKTSQRAPVGTRNLKANPIIK